MHHAKYSKYGVFMNIYFIFRHVLQHIAVCICIAITREGGVYMVISI